MAWHDLCQTNECVATECVATECVATECVSSVANKNPMQGKRHSDETKLKMSKAAALRRATKWRHSSNGIEQECQGCTRFKDKDEFYSVNRNVTGLDRSCKECRRNQNRITWAERRRHKKFGIQLDGYAIMMEQQKNCCAICERNGLTEIILCIDHSHSTGVIRGLLCKKCNTGIAMLGDEKDGIEKALRYIDKQSPNNGIHTNPLKQINLNNPSED